MNFLQQLFQRYRDGKSSDDETRLIDGWYAMLDKEPDPELTQKEWSGIEHSLWQKVIALTPGLMPVVPLPVKRHIWPWYAGAAASVAILFAVFYYTRYNVKAPTLLYSHYEAPAREIKQLTMPDGSRLQLMPGSSVSFAAAFDQPTREVIMENGEVYFDVAKDAKRPFIIHARKMDVNVLGTAFALRTIDGISQQEVLVENGRVQVLYNKHILGTLTECNRLRYDTATG